MKSSRLLFSFVIVTAVALLGQQTLRAAQAYIIADAQTGYVLEQQESTQKRQVGNLAAIATAMVVLDWATQRAGDLNRVATIPPEAFVGGGENNIGFQPGDQITLRDLLYAALVQSDNVAAFTLADNVGRALQTIVPSAPNSGSVAIFVSQMNALAKHLQMQRTRFLNPNGIDDTERPFSTAADLARLSRYALNSAGFRFYVSQKDRQISFHRGGRQLKYLLRNTNDLLGREGIDGVKTGRTARAGDCLILSAHRESEVVKYGAATRVYPRHVVVVILGSPNRFGEGEQLIARGWQLYDQWSAAGRMADPKQLL